MTGVQRASNPFEYMKLAVLRDEDTQLFLHEFVKLFPVSMDQAKAIWVSCPEFQEKFCRKKIKHMRELNDSSSKSAREHVGKKWLKRRYKLTDREVDSIYSDICANAAAQQSGEFLSIVTMDRIAKTQLTSDARADLLSLLDQFSV